MNGSPHFATLREKRRTLLEIIRSGERPNASALTPIARHNRGQPAPLSFSQERMWFLDQLALGSQFYVESSAVELGMAVDPVTLEQAINTVVQRHDILRTHFEAHDGNPVQIAVEELRVPLEFIDLSHVEAAVREREVERIALERAMRPFDLRCAPLLRASLLKLDSARFYFLVSIHHIVSDGWSAGIFGREVSACYASQAAGRQPQLAPLPIQYSDYAIWQRQPAQIAAFEAQLGFWRERLQDLPCLQLPTDRARPRVLSFAGAHLDVLIPPNLSAGLRALCRREQVTLFMGSLAVFAIVMNALTAQEDVVIGTPVAGRNRPELEPLIGVFLNTLLLRLDLSGDPSFRELLKRVKSRTLAAYAHQDVPFERLVEELQPARDLGRNPLFQVLFQFFTPPNERTGAAGAQPTALAVDRGTAILDLAWHLWDSPEGIRGRVEFSTELFERHSVESFFAMFQQILGQVIARSEQPLSALSVVPESQRARLLEGWQGTPRSYAQHRSLHQIFSERAARDPDKTAVIEGDQCITFVELDRRANQLARHLLGCGCRGRDRIAVCLERSASAIVAALAVFKIGACYVPLDPAYPQARLRFILEDSRSALMISDEANAKRLGEHRATVVRLDTDASVIEGESLEALDVAVGPLEIAYLIYTSGSTGRPKGVAGLHGATLNRFEWMWEAFPFRPGEVLCQRTALSFVDSIWEIFGPLLAGVPLVIVPDCVARDAEALVSLLNQHGVTRLLLVPSVLLVMLQSVPDLAARLPQLSLWFSSGEELSPELVRRFEHTLAGRTLVNLYGSSEVAGDILFEPAPSTLNGHRVSIGRPLANCRAYVLDRSLRLARAGTIGELYVSGPNLARGYWNQPALTAERFLPDPFCIQAGGRMYATGDLARYLPDGRLEYLGRVDQQVKVRGVRIELGELEAVLRSHPAVREAVADVQEDGAGGRLVAYVVADRDPLLADELRKLAGEHLPAQMVPSLIDWIDVLPLSPNGKLDRRALRSRVFPLATCGVPPRTEAEGVIAAIYAQLLAITDVDVLTSFFDLGGHSLLAIRLASRVRGDFGIEISLRDIFLHPSVADLAAFIEERLIDDIEQLSEEEARTSLQRIEQG